MAAPDRVYRYFTNLKSKNHTQSGDDIFYVRCAKPLSTYVGPLTQGTPLEQVKSKFKIDGILWVKNPDTPHQATDQDITVDIEIEDPDNPGQTITIQIDDPDLGDSNRDGFIAYVYPHGENAAFHDIRGYDGTPISNNGGNNNNYGATDYSNRSWSRVSKFRYKDSDDTEVAVILNDAGLNRRGEASVNTTTELSSFDFDKGVIKYCGSLMAPSYNRLYKCGVYFKWESYNAISHTAKNIEYATEPNGGEGIIEKEFIVPRNVTLNFTQDNPLEFEFPSIYMLPNQDDIPTIKARDWIFFRPFVINEEGEYTYDYDSDWCVRVPSIRWKVKRDGASNLTAFQNAMDADASGNNPFTEERANEISDDNDLNEGTIYGTMYLERKLPTGNSSGSSLSVVSYNSANLDVEHFFFGDTGYYYGGLYEEEGIKYFKWGVLAQGTVFIDGGQVNNAKYINEVGKYAPKIKVADLNTLEYVGSNASTYLLIDYYNADLMHVMDGVTESHGYVATNIWVAPNPLQDNNAAVIACIKEFNANFLSAIDDSENENHAEKVQQFSGPETAWGKASIEGMSGSTGTHTVLCQDIYKNLNQVNAIDGISAEVIRGINGPNSALYIYNNHLFTGAVAVYKMIENPVSGILEPKGYRIHIYVLGKYMTTWDHPTYTNGYQFAYDYNREHH